MRFEFMTTSEAYDYTIDFLCENLKVSKSGFYKWKKERGRRMEKKHREYELVRKIEAIHLGSKRVYGSPRIHGILSGTDPDVSLSKVERLMKSNDIRSKTKKKFKATTDSNHNLKIVPNHLMQDFTAQRPDQVWVSDITFVPTKEGPLYLCTVLDAFSRKIVGWTLESNMRAEMVKRAIEKAYKTREAADYLIFHSDRGVQYASNLVRDFLESRKAIRSMSRRANCWDNALMESFYGRFKVEHMFWESYSTHEEARRKIFEWIEIEYNRKRAHTALGNVSPSQFEEDKVAKAA
jgi:transposase InsO family protein